MRKKSPGKPPCGPSTTGPCRPKPPPKATGNNIAMADALFGIFGFRRVNPVPKRPTTQ